LIEYGLVSRDYTWSNGRAYALLDRFFCSLSWDNIYPHCIVKDLPKYGFNHCHLILCTQDSSFKIVFIFRFDKEWTLNLEFNRLLVKWWNEFPWKGNITVCWHKKIKYIKKKIKGQYRNYIGEKNRKRK
jgi:hypothetical protein